MAGLYLLLVGAFPRSIAIRGSPSGAGLLICIKRHLSASIPPKLTQSLFFGRRRMVLRCFRYFNLPGVRSLKVFVGRTCHCMNDNEALAPSPSSAAWLDCEMCASVTCTRIFNCSGASPTLLTRSMVDGNAGQRPYKIERHF
jgi:hypothetical protein